MNINSLPEELIIHIFSYFDSKFIVLTISLVNKLWRRLSFERSIWQLKIYNNLHSNIVNGLKHNSCIDLLNQNNNKNIWYHIYWNWLKYSQDFFFKESHFPIQLINTSNNPLTNTSTTFYPLKYYYEGTWLQIEAFFINSKDKKRENIISCMKSCLNHPIPSSNIYKYRFINTNRIYYEVTIIENENSKINRRNSILEEAVGIGFCTNDYLLLPQSKTSFPGWHFGSIGYHSDDGKIFVPTVFGNSYKEPWDVGDIVGCGYDSTLNIAFYTFNGRLIKQIDMSDIIDTNDNTLQIMIAIDTMKSLLINLGQVPFLFPIHTQLTPTQ